MSPVITPPFVKHSNVLSYSYTEMEGSPLLSFARGETLLTRKLKCLWKDRVPLARQFLGYSEYLGTDVHYWLPHDYRPWRRAQRLYCQEINNITGFAAMVESPARSTEAEYANAIMELTYKALPYEVTWNGPLATETIEPVTEFITLDNGKLYWDVSQNEKVEDIETPSFVTRMFDWVFTMHQMPYVPLNLLNLVGSVNETRVYSDTFGFFFNPETLLMGQPSIAREYKINTGARGIPFTVTVRMTARSRTWNVFPKASGLVSGSMEWSNIYDDSGNRYRPYPLAEFNGVINNRGPII